MSVNCIRIVVKYVSAVCGQADLHRYTFCFLSFALETYDLRQSSVDHEAKMYLTLLIFHIQVNKYPRSVHHSNKYNPF